MAKACAACQLVNGFFKMWFFIFIKIRKHHNVQIRIIIMVSSGI